MQSNHGAHLSHSPPAALSTAARPSSSIFDDMSIAQGLLNELKDPRHRSSLNSIHYTSLDGSEQLQNSLFRVDAHTEDHDEVDDRTVFVQEYNRLARKHAIRPMSPEEFDQSSNGLNASVKPGSWFSRKILRKASSSQSVNSKSERQLKHRRSISDLSLRFKAKKDKLKDKDLQELVRLCGSSLLYLPTEYAAGSLSVPTCFRATAQYLVQHAPSTRGVFRVPGSQIVVAALYNHYGAMDEDGQVVSGTVRCPTLPDHIRSDVHDVASAFKKFLSGLPGGILGTLQLFNSLISIQTQLRGDPELTRTKQSKVRARLIALAIATLRSQFRRELICAVFGLLSIIGRAAEIAPREDERGRPLPTSDLMGYGPLGIVFGPLLVGELLEDHTMRVANHQGGLVLLPISPPKSRKERHKKNKSGDEGTALDTHVDKIKVANSIAEMLITHWRDVVRHMKNLGALKVVDTAKSMAIRGPRQPILRPSASESFALRKPPDWDHFKSPIRRQDRSVSPTPARRITSHRDNHLGHSPSPHGDMLVVKKQRSKTHPTPNHRHSVGRSLNILAPTTEENIKDSHGEPGNTGSPANNTPKAFALPRGGDASASSAPRISKTESEGIYSPSTSSDDGKFPTDMAYFPGHRDDPGLELMSKENKHPRTVLPTAVSKESRDSSKAIEKHSYQPLHLMSTPAFSKSSLKSSPGKSSRKNVRISKDSSASSESSKPAAKLDTPRKLRKKSPGFTEKRKSDHFEQSKDAELTTDALRSEPIKPEVTAYLMEPEDSLSRSEAYFIEQGEAVCKGENAILETESAPLERRFNHTPKLITARKPLQESNSVSSAVYPNSNTSEGLHQGTPEVAKKGFSKSHSLDPEKRKDTKAENNLAGGFSAKMAALKDELETLKIAKDSFCEDGDGKPHRAQESALNAQLATYTSRWNAIKSDMDVYPVHKFPHLTGNQSISADQIPTQNKNQYVHNRPSLPFQRHLTKELGHSDKGKLDEGKRNRPFNEDLLEDEKAKISSSLAGSKAAAASACSTFPPFEHLSNRNSDEQERVLPTRDNIETRWKQESILEQSKVRDVSAEYRAFMAESNALTARWDDIHAQIHEPDFRAKRQALLAEIAMLDSRWTPIQAAMDAEKEVKVARNSFAKKYSLPFKHLVGKDEFVLSVQALTKPKINIGRSSSDERDEKPPKFPRRIRGSDPGLQSRVSCHSPRRVSRSLYDLPKHTMNLLAISKQHRDPLSRVSREDDAASLVVLAQAMNAGVENTGERGETSPNQNARGSRTKGKRVEAPYLSPAAQNSILEQPPGISEKKLNKDTVLRGGGFETPPPQQKKKIIENGQSFSSDYAARQMPSKGLRTKVYSLPSSPNAVLGQQPASPLRLSNISSIPNKNQDTKIPSKLTGNSSRISALVARFNNDGRQSPPLLPPISTTSSPAKSPLKTPTKSMATTTGNGTETPSNNIVAPYTTNSSSPTRSPKSEKTPQLVRTVAGGDLSILNPKSSPVRKPTPKRVLQESLKYSTPSRSIAKNSADKTPITTPSPTKFHNPFLANLRPFQKSMDNSSAQSSSKPAVPVHELDGASHEKLKASLDPKPLDSALRFPAHRFEDTTITKTEADSAEVSTAEMVRRPRNLVRSRSSTDRLSVYFHETHLKPATQIHQEEMRSTFSVFDGLTGALNIGRVLPRADPIPVAQHLKLPRPSTESEALNDYPEFREFEPHAGLVSGPPPGRSSSLLYNQVRILQRQLAEKAEEIQHLKHQLSAREYLDIGTLSVELREAKRDLQNYKTRAEVAEKQLEIVMKMHSRADSLKHVPSNSSRHSGELHRSSIEWRKEDGTVAERIRKALHGLDGAESMQRRSSDESTDTVIRDLERVFIVGSEYSNWMEQAMFGEPTRSEAEDRH
ncbi:hypothetical protein JHW43_006014 [Diplocarpon mali]|nr:hypothetical protein JHW43_006014 [Diplocarpon mali]